MRIAILWIGIFVLAIFVSYLDVNGGGRALFSREDFGFITVVFCTLGCFASGEKKASAIISCILSGAIFVICYAAVRFLMLGL
jgi:hypothetical protein